jgi:Icc protein
MLICQISDTHIKANRRLVYKRVDTATSLEHCIAEILRLPQRPDIVLFTGDIGDLGTPEEYALVRELLAPIRMPIYLIPGNHDSREHLRTSFPDHAYMQQGGKFIQYAIDDYPVRLIALDTAIPQKSAGELCDERLDWLEAKLAEARDRPTIVMMHHAPFATGLSYMDGIGLIKGTERLGRIIEKNPQVERIVCGHLHRTIVRRFHGTVASTCTSPAHQSLLDLEPGATPMFVMEPPGFQLHVWTEQIGLVTHTVTIGDFDGPHPYFINGKRLD